MKLLRLLSFVALASMTSAMWPQDREHKDLCPIVFDAPGAGSGAGLGTFVQGITSTGSVAGYTIDDNYVFHGFIRTRDGAFTIVDMPQAGNKSTQGTLIFAMNALGEATGRYQDQDNLYHGFLRTREGTLITVDVPQASTSPSLGTYPANIDDRGTISGSYSDAAGFEHGFLRTREGNFTTFDVPGSTSIPAALNTPNFYGMNQRGALVGYYFDSQFRGHGWLRSPEGEITEFDVPGSDSITRALAINQEGIVVGGYVGGDPPDFHGFLRDRRGNFTSFDAPGDAEVNGAPGTTIASSINSWGQIVGNYSDYTGLQGGFVREPDGTIRQFTLPGSGPAGTLGTTVVGNNDSGWITGWVTDANNFTRSYIITRWPRFN